MKKYISKEVKNVATVSILCLTATLIGLIFSFAKGFDSDAFIVTLLFVFFDIIFFTGWIAERDRTVIIDDEKVLFPRGADRNGKMVFAKTTVKFCDVQSVESKLQKGDGFITGDCFLHTLYLKDGSSVSVYLYAYGKENETEIIETIRQSIT